MTADIAVNEAALRETLDEHGLFNWIGMEIESLSPGRAVVTVEYDEKFANLSSGTMHGGVTATVIDTVSGFAIRSTMDDPSDANLTTTDLNVRYVRPVYSELRVEAEVVRAGRTMAVTECEATVEHEGEASETSRSSSDERSESDGGERKVAATGGTTYRLFRGEGA